MVLEKKTTLFERDEKGELLPKEVPLVVDKTNNDYETLKDETIVIIPLTRGELRKFFGKDLDAESKEKDLDGELIVKNCIKPSYNEKDVKHLRPGFATAIVDTIFFESGLDVKKPRAKALEEKEDDFAKN